MNRSLINRVTNKGKLLWLPAAVIAAGVLGLLFAYFGVELIFVIVPTIACAVIGYRIHLDRLEQKTRQITEASRVHLATVEALATAIDARDQVGVGHVRRTQIYAVGMGEILGLSENDIDALRTGALLHDIGKLAVPDHILNKAGSLTPAEFEKAKIHAQVGASILETVGFDCPVIPTIKYHHEWFDGTGYPDGMSGEQIPLTARILAVADAFDTLRNTRPYRQALTREKARAIIQSESGTHFDPIVVNTLIRNLATLEAQINAEGLSYNDGVEGVEAGQHYVQQIKLANREVFSLYELARDFSASEDLDDALGMFTEKIGEFVPYDTCVVYLLNQQKTYADAVHVAGLNTDVLASRRIKVGQGATGYALKTRETVQNADAGLDFTYSQVELAGRYTTMAAVPLMDDDELIGAVTIYTDQLEEYGEEHIRLLETISRIGADAIGKTQKHDEAKTHALTDPMTLLPNARSLQMQFDKEVARSSRGNTTFQLLMLDLDGFKAVNDTYGHKVGDDMLRSIGQVIREQLRDYDFLARYGGDEFVALIPEADSTGIADLCERIEKAVAGFSLPVSDTLTASVGVSLGASCYPLSGENFDKMIVAADNAMYDRKMKRKRFSTAPRPQTKPDALPVAPTADALIVELDETHVIKSAMLN